MPESRMDLRVLNDTRWWIVEDHADLATVFALALERRGAHVTIFRSLTEVLEPTTQRNHDDLCSAISNRPHGAIVDLLLRDGVGTRVVK